MILCTLFVSPPSPFLSLSPLPSLPARPLSLSLDSYLLTHFQPLPRAPSTSLETNSQQVPAQSSTGEDSDNYVYVLCAVIKAPFTLKRFHSYTERLLRIAFRIRTVYNDTNSQEYEEAKGAKNAKTLEVRPKTTEKVFLLSVSDIKPKRTVFTHLHTYDTIPFSNSST